MNLSVCKSYVFSFNASQKDYSTCFTIGSEHLTYYQKVYTYLDDIEHAIIIRNKLAHGQWKIPLNSNRTDVAEPNVYVFLTTNDNIQKLDLLYNVYKVIAEIISSYVVYKDKVSTDNFKNDLEKKIQKIENFRKRIKKASFEDYCRPFFNIFHIIAIRKSESRKSLMEFYFHQTFSLFSYSVLFQYQLGCTKNSRIISKRCQSKTTLFICKKHSFHKWLCHIIQKDLPCTRYATADYNNFRIHNDCKVSKSIS